MVSEKVLQHCPTCSTKAVWQKQAEKCRHWTGFFSSYKHNPGVHCQAGGFWWQQGPDRSSQEHFLSSPCSRAVYLLRECRKMFRKIPGEGESCWRGQGGRADSQEVQCLLQGWWHGWCSFSWSSQCHLQPSSSSCPRPGSPPQCHTLPQHCFCTKAPLLHNNLKYEIRSEERKVAIPRRLYLNVTTAIQQFRVYLALCVGTMRHQTLIIHTTNRKLSCHLFKGTDQTHQDRIQVTTCWYLVQFPCSWSINSSP